MDYEDALVNGDDEIHWLPPTPRPPTVPRPIVMPHGKMPGVVTYAKAQDGHLVGTIGGHPYAEWYYTPSGQPIVHYAADRSGYSYAPVVADAADSAIQYFGGIDATRGRPLDEEYGPQSWDDHMREQFKYFKKHRMGHWSDIFHRGENAHGHF